MQLLKDTQISKGVPCPYLSDREFIQEYFFAYDLNEEDFEKYLSTGWRRFGLFFFRPACRSCCKCVPIRVVCSDFTATKSQRRVLKKNINTEVKISPPVFRDEIFDIYKKHSQIKFGNDSDVSRFRESFYTAAVPSVQSEYYIEGKLVGVGFLDISGNALSSVYFVYDPEYSSYSLGTFSILKEIEIVKELGISYYNLGYWIAENASMAYKGKFSPYQTYRWEDRTWYDGDCYESDNSEDISQKENIKR